MGIWRRLFGGQKVPSTDFVLSSPADLLKYLPLAFKSVRPQDLLPGWKVRQEVWRPWELSRAVSEGMVACSWVFACVYRKAKAAASVPWILERQAQNGWVRVEKHPLLDLLSRPNAFMSLQDVMERAVMHLELAGNALWTKNRVNDRGGSVKELWPISPDRMRPIMGGPGEPFVLGYKATTEDGTVREIVDTQDVIHWQYVNPADDYWGLAPLQAVARSVDTDVDAIAWNRSSLQNRAVADGVFTFAPWVTQEQYNDLKAMVREQHQGPENARTPWVLGGEAKWQQMGLTPIDMDYLGGRKFTRVEICAVCGVPPPLIGDYEHATLANIEESRLIFWLDTIVPLLDDLADGFNLFLTPEYGADLRLRYDLAKVQALMAYFERRVNVAEKLWKMGVPFNLLNEHLELGLPAIPGGNTGYVPANMVPAGSLDGSSEAGEV